MTSATRTGPFAGIDVAALAASRPDIFKPNYIKRSIVIGVGAILFALICFGFWRLEFSFVKIINGISQLGTFTVLMFPPDYGTTAKLLAFLYSLGETLAIALLGTLGAALFAFPLGFLAARNVISNRIFHFFTRRTLDTVRGVDTLIWALIWINVVGLGPFAGVLAVMTSDIGSLSKLFSEAVETADKKAVEGIVSTGGSHGHAVRFGILPQVLPVLLGQILYYFESNTRSATIIGVVGAGGIGAYLNEAIRTLEWQQVSFLIILVLITVAVIDFISSRLRFAIIGTNTSATRH